MWGLVPVYWWRRRFGSQKSRAIGQTLPILESTKGVRDRAFQIDIPHASSNNWSNSVTPYYTRIGSRYSTFRPPLDKFFMSDRYVVFGPWEVYQMVFLLLTPSISHPSGQSSDKEQICHNYLPSWMPNYTQFSPKSKGINTLRFTLTYTHC